jgi:glucose-1-phosphate cytidylyltransferase
MKTVILAGGFGTRINEETEVKPKPMVEIGGKPILWHIMKIYSHFGFNEFIICLGYRGYVIKEYFSNYYLHQSDVTFDFLNGNTMTTHSNSVEPWVITLVDTGQDSKTGERILRIRKFVENEPFMLTYGDGVGDVNIPELIEHHEKCKKAVTVTAVQPPGRFGALGFSGETTVNHFNEKPVGDNAWINGGFFVMNPDVFDYIDPNNVSFEKEPLESLTRAGQLSAYKHHGFWKPMDTLRDKKELERLWLGNRAPWQVW